MILITGHPRTGTASAASMMQEVMLMVAHEKVDRHGTVNWMMAVKADKYPFGFDNFRRQDLKFDELVLLLREPVAAINSIAHTESDSEEFRSKFVLMFGNEYERATMSYIGWNKLILSQMPDYVVAIENFDRFIAAKYGIVPSMKHLNKREHKAKSKEQLMRMLSEPLQFELEKFIDFYESICNQF